MFKYQKRIKFNMNKKGFLVLALLLVGIVGVIAQSTNPWSADASGKEKNVFLPSDSIYVQSYTVCFGMNNISLYLLDKNAGIGDSLVDIRGQAQNIKTTYQGFIILTKIASNLSSGGYTIVLDCNNNGKFDSGENSDVFNVEEVGMGSVKGEGNNFTFTFDADIGDNEMKMLSIEISVEKENAKLQSFEIQASGTGNDVLDIEKIKVYAGNELLKEAKYSADNGKIVIALDNFSISSGKNASLTINYVMKNFIKDKTYSLSVLSISAIGEVSGQKIALSGLPIASSFMTIGETKTCSGSVNINLSKDSVETDESVKVDVSGIQNCSSPIFVRLVSCGNNISLCQLANNSCSFAAPPIAGSYAVFACIDKNNNGNYNDAGESESKTLIVKEKVKPIVVNETLNQSVSNITPITGDVVEDVEGNKTSTGMSFNVITILSIGMIIIFVILVVILIMLFKLAGKK